MPSLRFFYLFLFFCLFLQTESFATEQNMMPVTAKIIVKKILGKDSVNTPEEILFHDTIEEFLALTKIPRPSHHTEKILAYLQTWAESHQFKHNSDSYGNFWFDVPASTGCESMPKLILQAHMDMVCVNKDGTSINPETFSITPVLSDHKLKAKNTSLGADDGIGVGMALAIAKGKYRHGPLRILITTDEESVPNGAEHITEKTLDAEYLLNLDDETIGQITISTAGSVTSTFYKTHTLQKVQGLKFELDLSGLRSGHSGIDINKNRMSSISFICNLFDSLNKFSILYNMETIRCGIAGNAIPSTAVIHFFISPNNKEKAAKAIQAVLQKMSSQYPQEKINLKINSQLAESQRCLSPEDSAAFIAMLQSLPQGVLKMSQDINNLVETSSNNGILHLEDGKAEILTLSRSSQQNQLDRLCQSFSSLAQQYNYSYSVQGSIPAWSPNLKSKLLTLVREAYKHSGVDPNLTALHAYIECAFFVNSKPNLQQVCIGPSLKNPHTTEETLYLDSIMPLGKTVLYILKNITR